MVGTPEGGRNQEEASTAYVDHASTSAAQAGSRRSVLSLIKEEQMAMDGTGAAVSTGYDYVPLVAKDAGQEVGPGRGTVAFRSRRMRGEKGANSGVGRRAREDAPHPPLCPSFHHCTPIEETHITPCGA